ncbi:MAG: hypothetical protein ACRC62_09250 [Microcoleus sp.]
MYFSSRILKKEEGRRKKEEGRRKKEEGRRKEKLIIVLILWYGVLLRTTFA